MPGASRKAARTRAYGRSAARLSTRLGLGKRFMSKADHQREERLAAALRDNLKRRKAQARDSEPPPPPPSSD